MGPSAKKKQHYLPRFYLRHFASDTKRRTVSLFNLGQKQYISSASIRHQASGRYIYGQDEIVEDALMRLEDEVSRVLDRVLQRRSIPSLNSLDHQALLAYILLQRRRTPQAGRELIDSVNKPLAIAFREDERFGGIGDEWVVTPENPVITAMAFSSWLWPLLLDLKCKLLLTRLSPGFLTSDSPVIYYNQYLEDRRPQLGNTGLLTIGLQVFLPLSSGALIALYDGAIYKLGRGDKNTVEITNRADLDAMNALQVVSADHNLYFSSDVPPCYLHSLLRGSQALRQTYRVSAKAYRCTSDPRKVLIHLRPREIRSGLRVSFIRLHKRVRKLEIGTSALIPRDKEMWDLMQEFIGRTKRGELGTEDFFFFLVDKGKLHRTVASNPRRSARRKP